MPAGDLPAEVQTAEPLVAINDAMVPLSRRTKSRLASIVAVAPEAGEIAVRAAIDSYLEHMTDG